MADPPFFEKIKDLCYIRRRLPEVITRREHINGEEWFVIFDDVGKGFYKLKGEAWKIWEKLDGKTPVKAIVSQLQEEYSQDPEVIMRDVCKFISKVGKKGLIKAAVKKVEPVHEGQVE